MASIDAENVGKEVLETLGKGKKVILGEIIKKNGYAQNTADNPKNVTETESYKKVVRPLAEGISKEIEKIKEEMATRDITLERYETLANVMDKLVKNHQLLTGGATENIAVKPLATLEELKG